MTATVQTLAAELYAALISATRTNGETFYKLREGSPEWMTDAIQSAHGDMLPDDMRYSMIRDVALRMSDADDSELEDSHGAVDGLVDVYTARLTHWLASHLGRVAYVDQALEDNGGTLGPDTTTANLLMWGQYGEFREIWDSLAASLASEEEAREDQAGTDEGEEWSGSPCPVDPDNFWIDDDTGERVNAITGARTAPKA